MKALKIVLIVAALAIFGCAGGPVRECVQGAMDYHVKEVEYIETFDYDIEDKLDMAHDSASFSLIMIRSCLRR